MAGATGTDAGSPMPLAPKGPFGSSVSTNMDPILGMSAAGTMW